MMSSTVENCLFTWSKSWILTGFRGVILVLRSQLKVSVFHLNVFLLLVTSLTVKYCLHKQTNNVRKLNLVDMWLRGSLKIPEGHRPECRKTMAVWLKTKFRLQCRQRKKQCYLELTWVAKQKDKMMSASHSVLVFLSHRRMRGGTLELHLGSASPVQTAATSMTDLREICKTNTPDSKRHRGWAARWNMKFTDSWMKN